MMLLVHCAPVTLAPYRTQHLGVLSSPRRFYMDIDGWRWAADNDAFSDWNPDRYRRMLDGIWGLPGCLFVTAPDVVGDADRTLDLFEEWYDELTAVLQPIAFVLQDGITTERVPWQRIDAVFVGGSTRFKMGEQAQALIREARTRGLWVHMGRVNSHRRVRYAKASGCHSIDGMKLAWYRDTWLREYLKHAAAPTQLLLEAV